MQILLGIVLAIIIAVLAWRVGALSISGAWAAALCGGLIFGLGGWRWAVLLLTFFISSSLLSRLFVKSKYRLIEKFAKGSRRDWGQVIANGGLGAVLVIVQALAAEQTWPWVAYVGAMAAVNADTWATELGVLNPKPPRLITSGQVVERGTSGGVSFLGSLSALAGALLIALCAAIVTVKPSVSTISPLLLLAGATLGGLVGSFLDSLLGATIQGIYFCPACQKETESNPTHLCGTRTTWLRGAKWFNNDLVNFSASLMGALLATFVIVLFT